MSKNLRLLWFDCHRLKSYEDLAMHCFGSKVAQIATNYCSETMFLDRFLTCFVLAIGCDFRGDQHPCFLFRHFGCLSCDARRHNHSARRAYFWATQHFHAAVDTHDNIVWDDHATAIFTERHKQLAIFVNTGRVKYYFSRCGSCYPVDYVCKRPWDTK